MDGIVLVCCLQTLWLFPNWYMPYITAHAMDITETEEEKVQDGSQGRQYSKTR